jgi:hypothetical protein
MKMHFKKQVVRLIALLGFCAVSFVVWHFVPAKAKANVYRALPYGGSYSTYERLANLLKLGMVSAEVRDILGKPGRQEDLDGGQRWEFSDVGPTAGWTCIVDFAPKDGGLRLCYFFDVQHVVFTNSLHHQFGSPVDGGDFRGDPLLKIRREQWYPK